MTTLAETGEEFHDDFRRQLPKDVLEQLSRLDPLRSSWAIAQTSLTLLVAISIAVYFWHPLVLIPAIIIIGVQQHALFVLAHDAAHYRLFENRSVNDWLGRLMVGVAGFSMLTYRITHRLHHNNLYQQNDPDIALHGGYPRGKAYLLKRLSKDLLGLTAFKTYAYFAGLPAANTQTNQAVRPLDDTAPRLREAAKRDRWMVLCAQIILLAISISGGFWLQYLVLWVLPLLTVVQVILRLRAICEHGATTDFSSPLTAARTNLANAFIEWLLFPHHVNYHIEHHLYASIPHYNLPRCHREMMRHGILDAAEVLPFHNTLGKIFAERRPGTASY